ncbi:ABC transporter substrate-binding protein [Arthrobacter halodurans]|uniref:ABC transporter substrate-binding protein n=1 Tax=Arthrobacter halodurans TaxID=516699 RepID=A0ABV4UJA0_9MICC
MPKNPKRPLTVVAATLAIGALALTGCSASSTSGGAANGAETSNELLTIPREDTATFTSNFNPFSPNALPMTQQSVFEPLLIVNPVKGEPVPWLGASWVADDDARGVTFTLREGVKWSDGKPLTADDVVYTFKLQKEILGGFDYLDKVSAVDAGTVRFDFDKPYAPGLFEVGQQVIAPKHVWSKIADPAKATNDTPVGTGPYTQVSRFQTQSFELLKNPTYWQPEKQQLAGIRMLAFAGNSGANLALQNGDVDWSDQFIPNVQKTFVDKDPEHRHFWYPTTGGTINWQLNTTKAPFNDPVVRKALSMAVDRDQVATLGMSGYTQPADCTGLSDAYSSWRDQSIVDKCEWTKLDVDKANQMLDEAGYTKGADGLRTLKDGKPFQFKFSVGSASSDWLSVAQIISKNMEELGVKVEVNSPDWSQVVSGYTDGSFDSGIVWSNAGATPVEFYRGVMSEEVVKPVGKTANENYHRFGDPEATATLEKLVATADPAGQKALVGDLQERFDEVAPVIPLFSGPVWGAYTDERFTGWPSSDNPYATLSARSTTTVLVLTSLAPAQ